MKAERQAVETIQACLRVLDGSEFEADEFPTLAQAQEASAALDLLTAALDRAEQTEKVVEAARVLHATPKIIEPGKQLRLISLCYFDGELDALIDALALASGGETG